MVAPIDYGVQIADPTQSFLSAFQAGAGIQEARLKQEQQTQQAAQQKLIQEGFTKLRSPNATVADYANLSMLLPESQAKSVRESFSMLSGDRQQTALQQAGQVFSAFKSGKPEIAISFLEQQIEGKRNSGDEAGAKFLETWRDVAKENPKATEDYFGLTISQIPGGDKVITNAISLSQEGRAAGEGPSKLLDAQSKAKEAEAKAKVTVATAGDDIARAKALRELEQAKARREAADADVAEGTVQSRQDLAIAQLEKERALTDASVGAESRAAGLAESILGKSVADAEKAVADAQIAKANATNAEAKSKAEAELAIALADKGVADAKVAQIKAKTAPEISAAEAKRVTAEAQKATVEAKYAEQIQIAGLNKTNWDIKNLQSQIKDRSEKLNLDRQTTQANVAEKLSANQQRLTDIPESARKLINESATQSATSKQAAIQYNDLASRIESAQGGKGRLTSASEWFASQLGNQDAWTQIRNEYTRVRNSVAIKSLPPGASTDADIQLALKGIPPENANAATLASFLRGSAKLQDIDSAINNSKTDWLSQNNGLLTRAKSTFIAGDYATKSGETFNDFAQRIVGDVAKKYRSPEQLEKERTQEIVSRIPTNQASTAVPAATPVDTRSRADAILRGGK